MKTHVGFLPLRAKKSVAAMLPDFPPISRFPTDKPGSDPPCRRDHEKSNIRGQARL